MRHKHADLAIKYFKDTSILIQRKSKVLDEWEDIDGLPNFDEEFEFRQKPKSLNYRLVLMNTEGNRLYITVENELDTVKLDQYSYFIKYLTDWIAVEV